MFERARLVHEATRETLLDHLDFSIDEVAQLVLRRSDAAVSAYSHVWPQRLERPAPWDPPSLSDRELDAAQRLGSLSSLITDADAKPRLATALSWATRDLDAVEFSLYDGNSMFGPTLAIRTRAEVLPLPSGFWPDAFESALIELAHQAARFDAASSQLFQAKSERALKALFNMSRLRLVGPFSDESGKRCVFALLVDERTIVLFDLVTVLDWRSPNLESTIEDRFDRLQAVRFGSSLSGPSGQLLISPRSGSG